MRLYDAFVKLVSTVGFPIGVTIYLLVRFEEKIENLNKSISYLTAIISTVIGKYGK
jgi:flagellar biogenesis protein FliO